jgi:hypothetical protein
MPRHVIVDVAAVIRNGAGERIAQHARITLRAAAHRHRKP